MSTEAPNETAAAGAQTGNLVEALKRLLKSRGITYRELSRGIGLSEASVKRIFAEESFTLRRLEEICAFLEIDFFELAKLARGTAATAEFMTEEQERALAADRRLLGVFYLVFNDWQLADITEHYELTKAEGIKLLAQLDRLKLIDLLPGDRVRLRVPKTARLRPDGAIRASHSDAVMGDFIRPSFSQLGGLFRFEFRELSQSSYTLLMRRIDRLAQEFNELAELDSYLPPDERKTVGMIGCIRPWQISFVTGLKPRESTQAAPATPISLVGTRRVVRMAG